MITVETIGRVRRDFHIKGKGIRAIARDRRLSRNTVRKIVRGEEVAPIYERQAQPLPKLGAHAEQLEAMLEANAGKPRRERLTATRIFELLQGEGYDGGYDAVRRYVKRWRKKRSKSGGQAFVLLVFAPGEAYQFDWSHEVVVLAGVVTKVKVGHMRLCHSRMPFVCAFPREAQEMVFEAHARAFTFFGGVCERGIYDSEAEEENDPANHFPAERRRRSTRSSSPRRRGAPRAQARLGPKKTGSSIGGSWPCAPTILWSPRRARRRLAGRRAKSRTRLARSASASSRQGSSSTTSRS